MFDGLTELELLARLAGLEPASPYEIVRETIKRLGPDADFEERWKRFLHDGFLAGSASRHVEAPFNWPKVAERVQAYAATAQNAIASPPGKDKLDVVFHRDHRMDDGRYNNNGWLQELPDPITKLTWDNAVLFSPKTARELGVSTEARSRTRFFVPS